MWGMQAAAKQARRAVWTHLPEARGVRTSAASGACMHHATLTAGKITVALLNRSRDLELGAVSQAVGGGEGAAAGGHPAEQGGVRESGGQRATWRSLGALGQACFLSTARSLQPKRPESITHVAAAVGTGARAGAAPGPEPAQARAARAAAAAGGRRSGWPPARARCARCWMPPPQC